MMRNAAGRDDIRGGVFRPLPALMIFIAALGLAWGCGGSGKTEKTPGEEKVGDMSDRSYFGGRQQEARISASGKKVRMPQFDGKFVWSEYAAPWCGPCAQQAGVVKSLDGTVGPDVVFLTVMTSEMGGYGHPATQQTAKSWAGRYGLDPDRVVAADLTAIKIPRHILYSPEGQMLFIKTGYMSADEIRKVLRERVPDWKLWKNSGRLADWMRR